MGSPQTLQESLDLQTEHRRNKRQEIATECRRLHNEQLIMLALSKLLHESAFRHGGLWLGDPEIDGLCDVLRERTNGA